MASDFATVINNYREKCARLLQDSEPNSAEYIAYSQMYTVFEQDKWMPANQRVTPLCTSLAKLSRSIQAHSTVPPEDREEASRVVIEARRIVRQWALDFIRDTGQPLTSYGL